MSGRRPSAFLQLAESRQSPDSNLYQNKELGWTMAIPAQWRVIERNYFEAMLKKAITDSSKSYIDTFDSRVLLAVQKDTHNLFLAIVQSFRKEIKGDWGVYQSHQDQDSYKTYEEHIKGREMKLDSSTSIEIINGIKFKVFNIKISRTNGELVLNQFLYAKLINGVSFGVVINSNNEKDKETLLLAWKRSIFDANKWRE
jgi:hypothetical protein